MVSTPSATSTRARRTKGTRLEGINRWVRVVKGKESAAKLVKEVSELLDEQGWEVETAEADANDWEDDDDESDEEEP